MMSRKSDYVRAIEQASTVEAKDRQNANDLLSLGTAEMTAGRFDSARRHLRAALDLDPFRTTYADAAWALSQLEYMRNNFEASLEWARVAADHGLVVRKWHMDFLDALKNSNCTTSADPSRNACRCGSAAPTFRASK